MLRILKVYKQWEISRRRRNEVKERELQAMESDKADNSAKQEDEPSKVGKQMSEMTTRKVIMLVLLLIVILPWFDGGIEEPIEHYQQLGLKQLHRLPQDFNQSGGITRSHFYSAFRDFIANVHSSAMSDSFLSDRGGGVVLHLSWHSIMPQSTTNSRLEAARAVENRRGWPIFAASCPINWTT